MAQWCLFHFFYFWSHETHQWMNQISYRLITLQKKYAATMKSNYLKGQPWSCVQYQDLKLQWVSLALGCFFLRHQQVNKKWTAVVHHSQPATIKFINSYPFKISRSTESNRYIYFSSCRIYIFGQLTFLSTA